MPIPRTYIHTKIHYAPPKNSDVTHAHTSHSLSQSLVTVLLLSHPTPQRPIHLAMCMQQREIGHAGMHYAALTCFDSESEPDETEAVGRGGLPSFSTPASFLQPTISTLSTEEDEGEELPPLKNVFHCQNIYTKIVNDGKEG